MGVDPVDHCLDARVHSGFSLETTHVSETDDADQSPATVVGAALQRSAAVSLARVLATLLVASAQHYRRVEFASVPLGASALVAVDQFHGHLTQLLRSGVAYTQPQKATLERFVCAYQIQKRTKTTIKDVDVCIGFFQLEVFENSCRQWVIHPTLNLSCWQIIEKIPNKPAKQALQRCINDAACMPQRKMDQMKCRIN